MATSRNDVRHIKSFKVDPKLRMFANCSQEVNEIRSEFQGGLIIKGAPKEESIRELNLTEMPKVTPGLKKKKTKEPPENILTNVFVRLIPEKANTVVPGEIVRKGNLVSARVPLTKLNDIQSKEGIISVEASRPLRIPQPKVKNRYAEKATSNILHKFRASYTKKSPVIIGIIDVGGFDFAHPDFLDSKGETRFHKIWDQGGDFRKPPSGFDYGSEFTKAQLNKAIKDSKSVKVPAHYIEKQSQLSIGSHGTHVASIAGGKSGVCPDAILIGVLIALKESDFDRRKSFYDSSCVVHALEYLTNIAVNELKLPISINISLGTNGHAHDGSDAASRWIDNELLLPGRAVTVAAGNAGQDSPLASDDLGFVMGRIHTSGKIKAQGLTEDIQWCVIGNGFTDVSENELEIWYPCQDRFSIQVRPPGQDWTREVRANEFIENMQLGDGSFISIYNDLYHPANGLNCLAVYLSPNFNPKQIVPIKSGVWQVRIKGEEVRNGEYHAWIERDDPRPLGPIGEQRDLWNFPSFFSEFSNVDDTSISSLACARNVISVGNLDHAIEKVNVSSSQGPTRDKRTKPEVIAPGTNITAAKGFAGPDELWISMTGTSMAAPVVCGVAAQMLSVESKLTSSQIQGIMVRTSVPLPGTDYEWKNDRGFGMINPQSCVDEARNIFIKKDLKA